MSWLKDTHPAFGSTGTGHLTVDVQSFAAEVTVTYDYDANDGLLTKTMDAPGAADDRHTVYDWDGGDSTMRLGKVMYDTLDDTGDVVRKESFTSTARGRMAGAAIDADGARSSSAAEVFDRLAAAALGILGSETDSARVKECPEGRSPVEGG